MGRQFTTGGSGEAFPCSRLLCAVTRAVRYHESQVVCVDAWARAVRISGGACLYYIGVFPIDPSG